MTHDFIDDFSEALEREKRGYVICVRNGTNPESGAHVRWDFDHWPEVNKYGGKEKDAMEAIACALSDGVGGKLTVLCDEERNRVLWAIGMMVEELRKAGHEWTGPQKEMYQRALEAVGVPKVDDLDESP